MSLTLKFIVVFIVALTPLLTPSYVSGEATYDEYYIPLGNSSTNSPHNIVNSNEGSLWFLMQSVSSSLYRITANGEFTGPYLNGVNNITSGLDGAVWASSSDNNSVSRVSSDGSVMSYSLGTCTLNTSGKCYPNDITTDPSGNVWVTENTSSERNQLAKISPSGQLTNYRLSYGIRPHGIVAGNDGALWYGATTYNGNSSSYVNKIGRIASDGTNETYFDISSENASTAVGHLAVDSIGDVWFNEPGRIGRITTDGVVTHFTLPVGMNDVSWLNFDSQGTLWFGSSVGLVKMSSDGNLSVMYPNASSAKKNVSGVAIQSNGDVWFTELYGNRVAVLRNLAPIIPRNLTASSPAIYPHLSWDAASGAQSYDVHRDGVKIDSTSTTDYIDTLVGDGTHEYYVTAVNSGGESEPSNSVTVVVDATAPVLGMPVWSENPLLLGSQTNLTVPASDNLTGVSGGEYYIGDADPGQGSATAMTWDGSGLRASIGSNLTPGIYPVHIRAQDIVGNWSEVVTDYLVVYSATNGGVEAHGNNILPTYGTDILPGLTQAGQTDKAKVAVSVRYAGGQLNPASSMHFEYATGTQCNNAAKATNCHSIEVESSGIYWLVITGENNARATVQGIATVVVDGNTTTNPFRIVANDGDLLNTVMSDVITVQVFEPGANPNTAAPLYSLSQPLSSGNVIVKSS